MQVSEEPSGPSKQPASFHPHYVLTMVFIGFALNLFDRQIIGILLQPIKQEFHLSDTALGLLSGLALPCSTRPWASRSRVWPTFVPVV